jgi:hypothetical protein
MPRIAHIAALWSLTDYPSASKPLGLDAQLRAISRAGFDGAAGLLTPEHRRLADKHGLEHLLGYISSDNPAEFEAKVRAQKAGGAVHINVQMDNHDTPPALAVKHWIAMERAAEKVGGVVVSLEVHRDTCTETPEKTYEIADRYEAATGRPILLNFDFSHLSVVKHLAPGAYAERLIERPDLLKLSHQCHFRPFNGHHCQVPVTHRGKLTPEVRSYLDFAREVMRVWKSAPANRNKTLFACPEMGPTAPKGGGYNITGLARAWPEAVVLRGELAKAWKRA